MIKRLGMLVAALVLVPAALAAEPPPGSYKNVEFIANVPLQNTISINFLKAAGKEVMFVSGRYGLRSYDIGDPANPVLLDSLDELSGMWEN